MSTDVYPAIKPDWLGNDPKVLSPAFAEQARSQHKKHGCTKGLMEHSLSFSRFNSTNASCHRGYMSETSDGLSLGTRIVNVAARPHAAYHHMHTFCKCILWYISAMRAKSRALRMRAEHSDACLPSRRKRAGNSNQLLSGPTIATARSCGMSKPKALRGEPCHSDRQFVTEQAIAT